MKSWSSVNELMEKLKKMETAYYEAERECLEALELSHLIYRTLYIMELDLDGTILFANDLYLNKMGLTLEEVKGKHYSTFSAMKDETFWNKLLSGECVSGEFKEISKYEKVVSFVATYSPMLDGIGRPYKIMKFAFEIKSVDGSCRS